MPPANARRSRCSSCQAPIIWAEFKATGTRAPLDAEPVPDGNLAIASWRPDGTALIVLADTVQGGQLALDTAPPERWVTHFATCPNAAEHRRR